MRDGMHSGFCVQRAHKKKEHVKMDAMSDVKK